MINSNSMATVREWAKPTQIGPRPSTGNQNNYTLRQPMNKPTIGQKLNPNDPNSNVFDGMTWVSMDEWMGSATQRQLAAYQKQQSDTSAQYQKNLERLGSMDPFSQEYQKLYNQVMGGLSSQNLSASQQEQQHQLKLTELQNQIREMEEGLGNKPLFAGRETNITSYGYGGTQKQYTPQYLEHQQSVADWEQKKQQLDALKSEYSQLKSTPSSLFGSGQQNMSSLMAQLAASRGQHMQMQSYRNATQPFSKLMGEAQAMPSEVINQQQRNRLLGDRAAYLSAEQQNLAGQFGDTDSGIQSAIRRNLAANTALQGSLLPINTDLQVGQANLNQMGNRLNSMLGVQQGRAGAEASFNFNSGLDAVQGLNYSQQLQTVPDLTDQSYSKLFSN